MRPPDFMEGGGTPHRHLCGPPWAICCVCGGRLHIAGCTSRHRWEKDCCPERHHRLADLGYLRGIDDSSQAMTGGDPARPGYALSSTPQNPTRMPEGFPFPKEY